VLAKPIINLNARYSITTPRVLKLLNKENYPKLINITNPSRFAGVNTDGFLDTDWQDALKTKSFNCKNASCSPQ
jgi:hypothetical protein